MLKPISIWRLAMPLIAAIYCATFWLVYVRFLHPVFGYANYDYMDRSPLAWSITIALIIAPVLLAPLAASAVSALVSFLYALYYVPAVFCSLFSLHGPYEEVFQLQFALAVGMVMLFIAARSAPPVARISISKSRANFLFVVSLLIVGMIAFTYRGSMRIVSFSDVYSVRSAANDLSVNPLVGYAMMWLSYCLIPFSLIRGWVHREWRHIAVALLACVVTYAANGAKTAAITPVYVFGTYFLATRKGPFLPMLLLAISGVALLIVTFSPFDGPWMLLPSLFFERTMGTPGNLLVGYYEVFPKYGLTYFSQINVIQNIFGGYPYGNQSLGQVMATVYFGGKEANFNAGFWSMDGIASLGIPGIYFIDMVVAGFCAILARRAAPFDPAFMAAWICTFSVSLINISFFTSLTSSGGFLFFLLFYFVEGGRRGGHAPPWRSSAQIQPAPQQVR